jgi:hypothetical protein
MFHHHNFWILRGKRWKWKNQKKLCCQTSTTVRVHGTDRVCSSVYFGTTVRVHGMTMRAVRSWVFAFFVLFHHLLFWTGLWCKMKVLDNFVTFPMALGLLENVLWFLWYEENTPSRSWRNFKETWHNYSQVNPKLMVCF